MLALRPRSLARLRSSAYFMESKSMSSYFFTPFSVSKPCIVQWSPSAFQPSAVTRGEPAPTVQNSKRSRNLRLDWSGESRGKAPPPTNGEVIVFFSFFFLSHVHFANANNKWRLHYTFYLFYLSQKLKIRGKNKPGEKQSCPTLAVCPLSSHKMAV